jgi:curved DNA-binding protein CbpA
VGVGASPELCRKRYLALALRLHPDKMGHPQAKDAFTAVERAYSRIRD